MLVSYYLIISLSAFGIGLIELVGRNSLSSMFLEEHMQNGILSSLNAARIQE